MNSAVYNTLIVVGSFVAMEGVSYGVHRWIMHGPGIRWHASHHRPPQPGWEANDIFPALFSLIGITVFALASFGPKITALWWVGIGVTGYGVAYMFVHDIYIHQRPPIRVPRLRYLEWVRRSHGVHHLSGAEPYGMLLPLLGRPKRLLAERRGQDVMDRRTKDRVARSRL